MFKTREILKASRENVKNNFWVFFFAILIYYFVFGLLDGGLGFLSLLGDAITNIRAGNFVKDVFFNLESELFSSFAENPFVRIANVISLPVGILILNPFMVGLCGLFLKGTEEKTQIKNLFMPFKKNYKKILKTTLQKYILLSLILIGLSMALLFLSSTISAVFYILVDTIVQYSYVLEIIFQVVMIAVVFAYFVFLVYVIYSFSMIEYIIAQNPDINFAKAYVMSKEMTKKKKLKLFKVDICYAIIEILIALVPIVLISVGLIKLYADLGGMLWFVAGVYSFIPVIIFVLLVEVYKTSAWANMYKRLKLEQDVFDESASIQTIEEKTENE